MSSVDQTTDFYSNLAIDPETGLYSDRIIDPETGLYYNPYPSEGDEVPESFDQFDLVIYLTNLLRWLFHQEGWTVIGDICIRKTKRDKHPIVPDLGVFKVVFTRQNRPKGLRTWAMWEPERPAPFVVFEISSADTWLQDLNEKPRRYQELGVMEYFAYDPTDPPYWKDGRRLRGWSYRTGQIVELAADGRGWLWSEELNSWLEPDGEYLRLRDRAEQRRLTEAEAQQAALDELLAKLRAKNIDPNNL